MSSSRRHKSGLRIVVQYVHGDVASPWHLVVYGSGRAFLPRCFSSVDNLLKVVRSAIPEFDPGHLLIKSDSDQSYIVWAGDIILNDPQLATLGLKTETCPKS